MVTELIVKEVRIMKPFACSGIGVALFLGLAGISASAQTPAASQDSSSGSSLGAYARQVRKDPGTTSKPKVYDNDNLPREDKLSVVGTPSPSDNSASAAPADSDNATTANAAPAAGEAKAGADAKTAAEVKPPTIAPGEDEAAKQAAWKQWGDKIAGQKDQIDMLGRELDVLQREYQLRAAAMYADVGNRLRNSGDWDKQDADYKQKIADKQKALDDAKQKLEDIQEEARKAGTPSSIREP
jgi:hypothetical protein